MWRMWCCLKEDNMKKLILLLIIGASFGQSSCERDDICAETTPTTPLLIIRFYDANDPSEFKAPNNLSIVALESLDPSTAFLTTSSDSIAIPLRTVQEFTTFSFTINSGVSDEEAQNEDILTFIYTTEEEFVNKACGFRIVYEDLQDANAPQADGAWIQNIEIENPTVNDQTEAHVSIFH